MRLNRCFTTAVSTVCLLTVCATISPVAAQTFSNPETIVIDDNQEANPYPSIITIAGLDPTRTYTLSSVLLQNVSHTVTSDLDILLVGPDGTQTLLMSDNFADLILNNVNLQFSDTATVAMGSSGDLSLEEAEAFEGSTFDFGGFLQPRVNGGIGKFQPSNFEDNDIFALFAPPGPYSNNPLASFSALGSNLNGQAFRLFVQDDALLDTGSINGGWELTFTSFTSVIAPEPEALPLLLSGIGPAVWLIRKRRAINHSR
jgi:hypothetical protein